MNSMFESLKNNHNLVYGSGGSSSDQGSSNLSHEVVAGAASFAATKMFEDRQRKKGLPVSHSFAKKALSALAGSEIDKIFETKGLNHLDKEQTKNEAIEKVKQGYDESYGQQDQWSPESQSPIL
ncbi:conserved hypothetical protein [Candida tropicalis MYA-3404]|uniref:CipC-like antibiotic response protein n=1 Tax=Candida tropicalis (strain ATCC MYA-3404 / T1) TaxID=294747 RepID=C5MDJ9_CANTT|nr:conserved hypothetical protein [Candida tropicalis MYA-3404]EER32080.1 conserved hypothetical protein [Candida tropicalis MYA-3404]KAG4405676.1 hypothetical protein JTP64_004547 [Candida tropicalis]